MVAGHEVRLLLHSGVPVVDVLGEWNATVTSALTTMIGALASAGHYEIVIDVRQAGLDGISALASLTRLAQAVRSHCGHIDIVGTADQIQELLRQQLAGLFRFTASEEEAIGHIKRVPILASGERLTAKPQ